MTTIFPEQPDRRRVLGLILWAPLAVGGCSALPRAGPLGAEIRGSGDPRELEGLVAALTADIASRLPPPPETAFPPAYRSAGPLDPTRIGVDDQLEITVWESEGTGLLKPDGGATVIPSAVVDPSGRIFVPFSGLQRASGLTIAQLRETIRTALEPLTLSPQVDVRMLEARSRLVAIQGSVASPGIYPIERPTRRLAAMIAEAGGATDLPERVEVVVQRNGALGRQILADVLEDSALNIALRPDDLVTLNPIRERFIVLGASGVQAEIPFPTRPLDLLSAIGAARGLRDTDADPEGVFVFRYEQPAFADSILPGDEPSGLPTGPGRPIVYRLDLSQPEGLFIARNFEMRDGDAIFVTNAPLTELRKFLQLFFFFVAPVNEVQTFAGP